MMNKGDKVRIIKGEFKNHTGIAEVLLDKLVRVYSVGEFQVWVPYDYLEVIERR